VTEPRLPDCLTHILDAIGRIQDYVAGLSREDFEVDELRQDGVIRNLEVIGEASNRIVSRYPDFARAHPELELSVAYRMRNALAHGYFSINLDTVWDTIAHDLPGLASAIRAARDASRHGEP
jgi:uncharacterized protein with HEPN domain